MKRFYTLLILFVVFLKNIVAEPISEQMANQVGLAFLSRPISATGLLKAKKLQASLKLVYKAENVQFSSGNLNLKNASQGIVPFYVFNTEDQGYVVVSGDDRMTPILGYAENGVFDPNNIPPNMQKWLEGYKAEILYAIENNIIASTETQAEWQTLQSGEVLKSQTSTSSVAPLISTKWNQLPYYNDLCPFDDANYERTATGCVVTAMAQVMKYWNYPATGSGFHSYTHSSYGTLSANFGNTVYDWENMPIKLTSLSSSAQKDAIATLMYHCGVAVDMDYNTAANGGSAAKTICSGISNCTASAEDALKTYFGYKIKLHGVYQSDYSNINWISLLKSELDAGRPIIYAGRGDAGGHSFVCDGYDNNDYFHFNWGWGGYCDGFFVFNALSNVGSYSFNESQKAIVGIEPENALYNPQRFDLCLSSELKMSSSLIKFRTSFNLVVDVANIGTGSFIGQLGGAVFDNKGNFVDFMEIKSDVSLNSNDPSVNSLTFSNSGSAAFVPGTYYVALFYKTDTQDWTIVANGNYSNLSKFEIYNSGDIEVNSVFTISKGTLIQGQTTTVNVDVVNTGSSTFYGKYRVNLAHLDGSWAQNIQILSENNGLPTNYHYTGGNNFTGKITVEPGTYLLEIACQTQGASSWYYAGSTNFSNPICVVVKSQETQSDVYEDNDTQMKAYSLPVSFVGSNATPNSNGSNLHIGTDVDYYKIVLPSGYNYDVTPKLNDSYNIGNGHEYTVDVSFSYSTDEITYSETYDDVMANPITVNNGGTVYFKVVPYFSGNTGTYMLDFSIVRAVTTGSKEIEMNKQFSLYPNPAADFVTIDMHEFSDKMYQIALFDIKGNQLLINECSTCNGAITLSLKGISNGIYFIHIHSDKGVLTEKLVVKK